MISTPQFSWQVGGNIFNAQLVPKVLFTMNIFIEREIDGRS